MNELKKINNALISVFDKNNLEQIVTKLDELGVNIYSTGGTQSFIEKMGCSVSTVESLTSYPSILGGRVKTLHPKVFGGILSRRGLAEDETQLKEYGIPEIDLIIVDLYPFELTASSGASHEQIIEKIDIGGISLIRAAAKNYKDVLVVPSKNEYRPLLNLLDDKQGFTNLEDRKSFAAAAFDVSSHYDGHIFEYFDDSKKSLKLSVQKSSSLRYGENPHQQGTFYGDLNEMFIKHHGKELSYNNLLDTDAAVSLMADFHGCDPTFAILKHNNACGCATRSTLKEAYEAALAADPVSAFGGILICNVPIDLETAESIHNLFCEVVIAPAYQPEALELLQGKKNRILLEQKNVETPKQQVRSVLNGYLYQDKDSVVDQRANFETRTSIQPTDDQLSDLEFAAKLVKHTKSNTIVLVKNQQLVASGVGQTSRVDALKQAILKANTFKLETKSAVMASDAFFPFPDCVEIAHKAGIEAVIQPGGSVKDQLSIDYCNEHNIPMVFTGVRHFKH